jgi:hypothetical protein
MSSKRSMTEPKSSVSICRRIPNGSLSTPGRLLRSLREAHAHSSGHLGAEHIARALLAMDNGGPHHILPVIGASAPRLGAAIRDRCRQAG